MTDGKRVRIALLGCGGHSKLNHAAPLKHYAEQHPEHVELVAACDLDGEKAQDVAGRFGFAAAYTDMDEMLRAAAPDAVVCVMAARDTVEMGIDLLRRGVTCTIEKPLGASASAAHALADVARQTGTPHMVSVNRRYWPHLVKALEWIGERSPLRMVRAIMLRNRRAEPNFIWGTGIHPLDALVHIAGPVESYDAHIVGGDELTAKWYTLSLDFADGRRGELQILPTCGRCEETYELFGEGCSARASMEAVSMDGEEVFSLHCWEDGKLAIHERIAEPDRPWLGHGSYGEVCALVRALREGTPLLPTVQDVIPATDICSELAERFAD